ncbi:MAG: ECF transporter S component, partial [Clostridia bacterium]
SKDKSENIQIKSQEQCKNIERTSTINCRFNAKKNQEHSKNFNIKTEKIEAENENCKLKTAENTQKSNLQFGKNLLIDERLGAKKISLRQVVGILIYLIAIPTVIFCGIKLFEGKKYNIISMAIAILACVPFFIGFEKGKTTARELVIIAVMIAITVVSRLIFAPIPAFKPITAFVIITAIALGGQAGFITGALSALVSNMFFGQGAWTPFQMFAWGFIGLIAGFIFGGNKKFNVVFVSIFGIISGVIFSLLMDIWTTLSIDNTFNFTRYLALVSTSLPFMAIYAFSNVVFIALFAKVFLQKLTRIKTKYGLFEK